MSKMINELLNSANPWKSLQTEASRLAKKWEKTGLLKNLNEVQKNNMALMLENQAKQLVVENLTGAGTAGGTFTAGAGEQWAGIALPLVRKIFGNLSAQEFLSVQPMNLPSGLVFYLDFQYGTDKAPFKAGQSVYGTRSGKGFGHNAEGGLYGAGRFSYSTNNASGELEIASVVTAAWADFNYNDNFETTFDDYVKVGVTFPTFTDFSGVKAFVVTEGTDNITLEDNLQAFTTTSGQPYNYQAAPVFFILPADKVEAITGVTLGGTTAAPVWTVATGTTVNAEFQLQTKDNKRGDFEDGNNTLNEALGTGVELKNTPIEIPEFEVKMESEPIVAKTKKLKAKWTPEFAQDLNAYQALDAEAELTNIMSDYVSLEIELELLDMLIQDAAGGDEVWSAKNNTRLDTDGTFTQDLEFFNTQGGWFQTLGTKIQKLSNNIHQKTLRGGANFMVISPQVATIIESIPGFTSNSDGDAAKMKYAFGVQKAGQLSGKYNVFKNPYMVDNVILLGYKGAQYLETGAVFSPYVPLIMTPLVYDPDTFTPRKGLFTRYAKKMLRPEFYARVYVNGLNTI